MNLKTTLSYTAAALFTLLAGSRTVNAQINGAPMPWVKPQFFTNGGLPAAGYKLCTYAAGTNTPQLTYTTSTLNIPNQDPVVLDSAGRANIFLGQNAYKFILLSNNSATTDCLTGGMNPVWSEDNILSDFALAILLIEKQILVPAGAGLIGYDQSLTYPADTVGARLERVINVADAPYNAKANGAGATGSDQSTNFQAAVNALHAAGGGGLFIPWAPLCY